MLFIESTNSITFLYIRKICTCTLTLKSSWPLPELGDWLPGIYWPLTCYFLACLGVAAKSSYRLHTFQPFKSPASPQHFVCRWAPKGNWHRELPGHLGRLGWALRNRPPFDSRLSHLAVGTGRFKARAAKDWPAAERACVCPRLLYPFWL